MLTNTQQQTIQFLTEQFEKLNASTEPKRKFNPHKITQEIIDSKIELVFNR